MLERRAVVLRAVVFRAAGLRVVGLRAAEVVPAPVVPALDARLAGLRAVDALRVVEALRAAGLRAAVFRVPLERDDFAVVDDRLAEPLELFELELSSFHLPDITRCAASATASAMIEPSRVALDIMLVAAWDAVSAASRPASRILRRAEGLALIAAAAAARPAASISLLIAALASLSTVLSPELELERLEVFRVDLAIRFTPLSSDQIAVAP